MTEERGMDMLDTIETRMREEINSCYELYGLSWPTYFYQYVRGLKLLLSESMRYEVSKISIKLIEELISKEQEEKKHGKEV